uniref:GWxTD domain-containing protein n=1 Tax=candidate division WOR-3 bacterium TaxID=2052148 RepID=A0A7C4TFG0_UNCW3
MNSLIFLLISLIRLETDCYRFNEGYVELWYRIPLSDICSSTELTSGGDSIVKSYTYRLFIYESSKKDSAISEGVKQAIVKSENPGDYIIDCVPIYLYPGKFFYQIDLHSGGDRISKNGEIEIPADTILFSCSDLILSKKGVRDVKFIRHSIELMPVIIPEYSNRDTLFIYFEIYGLIPDSLYYEVQFRITDHTDSVVFDEKRQRTKYNNIQFDTLFIPLIDFIDGNYRISIEVFDPASNTTAATSEGFWIKTALLDDITKKRFYYDIQYLVSANEYKKFCNLNEDQKKIYLKRFWQRHNYSQFEKRLRDADEKFSTPFLKGRDTPQGKFYIQNGPPDWIDNQVMEAKQKPAQIWHYEAKGVYVLFIDKNNDGVYELIKELNFNQDGMDELRELEGYIKKCD